MTATVAKKPRAAKRRKPKPMTTTQTKVAPTSIEQLPVVVTEERTKLGLFEIALLPFLYLEKFIQVMYDAITTRINSRR